MIKNKEYSEVSSTIIDRYSLSSGSDTEYYLQVAYESDHQTLKKKIRISHEREYDGYARADSNVLWVLN